MYHRLGATRNRLLISAHTFYSQMRLHLLDNPENLQEFRGKSDCFHSCYIVPTFISGFKFIFVWGVFSCRERTNLIFIQRTLKQEQYQKIVTENFIRFTNDKHGWIKNLI